eukprot:Opistho-1_new@26689
MALQRTGHTCPNARVEGAAKTYLRLVELVSDFFKARAALEDQHARALQGLFDTFNRKTQQDLRTLKDTAPSLFQCWSAVLQESRLRAVHGRRCRATLPRRSRTAQVTMRRGRRRARSASSRSASGLRTS